MNETPAVGGNEAPLSAPVIKTLATLLGRLRDLRKSDDDLMGSFSRPGAAPSPAAQLATILRDGPAVGVHVITWCDTLNNLNRALDRQTLRELGMRVLFQMSAADSSHLIDSPAASRLGLYRALLASEDEGRLEKFRPYGPPSLEWLGETFGSNVGNS